MVCSTRKCTQMAEFTTHPSSQDRSNRLLHFFLGTTCFLTTENTNIHAILNPIIVDVCPTTCTGACLSFLLHSCILLPFAPNGALQQVQTHRGCARLFLHLQHNSSLPSLLSKSSLALNWLSSLQLLCWAACGNLQRPTPLLAKLQLPLGNKNPTGSQTK